MLTTIVFLLLALGLILAVRIIRKLLAPPDFIIGSEADPYMWRWWILPRNTLFNIYLHRILRSDDDRALHDHPWINASVVLSGGYWEVLPELTPERTFPVPPQRKAWRKPGSIVLRWPTAAHRLEVVDGGPATWSLFITGPKVREWGFWCPRGWKKWTDFVAPDNTGAIGPGCGDA